MASLSVRNVRKRFAPVEVLHGTDIEVADGEFLILVGPSGCGKSTLLSMIAGLDGISEGEIAIAEMRKVPKAERDAVAARVAKTLQMEALLERRPAQLSGGQRQRVAMGRALARDPAVFLFDEPLSNLDAKLRVEMRVEIKALHQRLQATIVYVIHDQVEALTLGDRIAVMKDGRVQQLGTPEDVYERPENLYVAGFIGSTTMNPLPVQLRADGAHWLAELRTACGSAWVPVARQGPPRPGIDSPAPGRELVPGLRPEHMREVQPGQAGAFEVEIALLEPTGADTFGFADINGRRAALRLPPERIRKAGERLWMVVDVSGAGGRPFF